MSESMNPSRSVVPQLVRRMKATLHRVPLIRVRAYMIWLTAGIWSQVRPSSSRPAFFL
jgi:hypothetical protein